MSAPPRGPAGWLLAQGAEAARRAAWRLFSSGPGQEAAARAVGLAQRGVQALAEVNRKAMNLAGLPAKPDYDDLRKQLARLKRKARALEKGGGGRGENR